MGLNRMMMKNGQSKQLYHLKSSYKEFEVEGRSFIVLGFCQEETYIGMGITVPSMGSLSPNEYCGAEIKNILIYILPNEGVGYFGMVDFYGKLPENAIGKYELLGFKIPQLGIWWASIARYDESTNTTSCISDEASFAFDGIDSLENLYITIAPHVLSDSK